MIQSSLRDTHALGVCVELSPECPFFGTIGGRGSTSSTHGCICGALLRRAAANGVTFEMTHPWMDFDLIHRKELRNRKVG